LLATRDDEAMRQWRANRFGLFIHWGLYAVLGGEWQGKATPGAAEGIQHALKIPAAEYAQLVHQFNPTHFDAAAWARLLKQMGVSYVTITTKHHEGFCLWDSRYTDFDIAATPYREDLLEVLVRALTVEHIAVHLYYSIIDWHHPDYRKELLTAEDRQAFDRYSEFMKDQLAELLARHPETRVIWFDGTWDSSYRENPDYAVRLEAFLRKLKPDIILNNRLGVGPIGNMEYDATGRPFGDYNAGFERTLPPAGSLPLYDWEACMTLPENQWGYNKTWAGHVKTPAELIRMLVQCASQGGNFMINFGPKPDGTFREEELRVAEDVGRWLHLHGDAIYGTRASSFGKPAWGFVTEKDAAEGGRKIYVHVFSKPTTGVVKLPLSMAKVRACYRLGDPAGNCLVREDGPERVIITLPSKLDPVATVLAVEVAR